MDFFRLLHDCIVHIPMYLFGLLIHKLNQIRSLPCLSANAGYSQPNPCLGPLPRNPSLLFLLPEPIPSQI